MEKEMISKILDNPHFRPLHTSLVQHFGAEKIISQYIGRGH